MTSPTDVADHDWFVEEREYARHEARRGRRHAFEHLDPRRTALVVVDLVPFFVRESAYVRGIVPRVNALAAALRVRRRHGGVGGAGLHGADGEGPRVLRRRGGRGSTRARAARARCGRGSPPVSTCGRTTSPSRRPRAAPGPPARPSCPRCWPRRDVDTVVVTGTVTNVCVEDTVRGASAAGLRVILVADACAAMRDQDHNATLHVVLPLLRRRTPDRRGARPHRGGSGFSRMSCSACGGIGPTLRSPVSVHPSLAQNARPRGLAA